MTVKTLPPPLTLAFWLVLSLFATYTLSLPSQPASLHEWAGFTAAHNLTHTGQSHINQLLWAYPADGLLWQNGHLYASQSKVWVWGLSIFIQIAQFLGQDALYLILMFNAFLMALTGGVLFLWLVDRGFSSRVALLTALGYGLGSLAWLYARTLTPWPALTLCLLLMVWAGQRAKGVYPDSKMWLWAIIALLAGGMGLSLAIPFDLQGLLLAILPLIMYLVARALNWAEGQHHPLYWAVLASYKPIITG